LYLGALAISSISGLDITLCMIFLAFFAVMITLGGIIGYTDVIQVFFLILGGLVTTLALNLVAKVWIFWSYKWF
jgi:SSS family solute:Na+ symporter